MIKKGSIYFLQTEIPGQIDYQAEILLIKQEQANLVDETVREVGELIGSFTDEDGYTARYGIGGRASYEVEKGMVTYRLWRILPPVVPIPSGGWPGGLY